MNDRNIFNPKAWSSFLLLFLFCFCFLTAKVQECKSLQTFREYAKPQNNAFDAQDTICDGGLEPIQRAVKGDKESKRGEVTRVYPTRIIGQMKPDCCHKFCSSTTHVFVFTIFSLAWTCSIMFKTSRLDEGSGDLLWNPISKSSKQSR
ncbi:hypothetical protein BCR41DRAFT_374258 [Lobosporangium transversale]|uniref:Transmembrane protein n=1 Tax=Lobosporangium transversale TaxID=64571 RepID=A0A1Y2GF38_9FUNG|nr:hypothetical protein BCR41DRAFT_374258 [Lobosporangium transversale]ORZ05920.1 hypothetical protein BCR41DRAFT_374258 [Lobosporangium transversale]|eukprot:XP_021877301.1 hypothetical protein BCR41DRAFT_374258 [Lobosporangium transversale]